MSLLIRYGIQSERLINVSKYDVFVLLSVFFMSAYSSLSNKTKNRNKFNIFYSNIGDIDRYPYTFRWQNRLKIIMTPKRRLILVFMIYILNFNTELVEFKLKLYVNASQTDEWADERRACTSMGWELIAYSSDLIWSYFE